MNLQALMDMPGYGQANKRVKAMGMWRETMTDTERIEWLETYVSGMTLDDDGETYLFKMGGADCYDILADQIDKQATQLTAQHHRAYLED